MAQISKLNNTPIAGVESLAWPHSPWDFLALEQLHHIFLNIPDYDFSWRLGRSILYISAIALRTHTLVNPSGFKLSCRMGAWLLGEI